MKKSILFLFSLLLVGVVCAPPIAAQIGNVSLVAFPGVPTGACPNTNTQALNEANGNLYTCPMPGGAWVLSGGGSGGSYTFFGNTQNPLTALADPTTIADADGNEVTFSSSGLGLVNLNSCTGTACNQTATALANAVTTNSAGTFVTSPTPPAGAAGGFGAGNQPCSFFLGFTDAGCAAATNIYTFASTTPNAFRHGWNYYYQTDLTQVNDPLGMTLMCGAVPAASGINSTDMYCQEIGAFVGGGNAWSNGNPAAQRLRIGLVTTGTSVTGNMGGSLFYLPSFPTGTTLTGGIFGYACDAASTTGTVTGGYVCVEGGTIIGSANVFGSHTNPAFGINTGSGTVNDAYCWGSLGGTNIFTSTICIYQGSGSPQSVLTANVGSIYTDTTNGNVWEKNTGAATNTGWVQLLSSNAVSSVFGRTGAVTATSGDYSVAQVTGAAPLASPALTGTPTAPTAAPLTGGTQIATQGYADAAVAAIPKSGTGTLTQTTNQVGGTDSPLNLVQWDGAGNTEDNGVSPSNSADTSVATISNSTTPVTGHMVAFSVVGGSVDLIDGGTAPAAPLFATTSSVGGSLLAAGGCSSTAVSVTGASSSQGIVATPVTYPGDGNYWLAYRSGTNTVTVKVCAAVAGTPTASTYNIRVIQ